jgi:uncharacterized protein YutE (UPF0331/DUF86 family)
MDALRKKRYQDKINYILDSFKVLEEDPKNELEKRGIFYTLQTSIEAVVDLIAMAIKDLGIPVKDDETNIMELVNRESLNEILGLKLKKANGMRNIIVHRYNEFEEKIILNSIKEIKTLLMNWLDIIEKMVKKFD